MSYSVKSVKTIWMLSSEPIAMSGERTLLVVAMSVIEDHEEPL